MLKQYEGAIAMKIENHDTLRNKKFLYGSNYMKIPSIPSKVNKWYVDLWKFPLTYSEELNEFVFCKREVLRNF